MPILNRVKTFLAKDLSAFPIKDNPVFYNVPKFLPKNPPNFHILSNWVFDVTLADEPFTKALQSFRTCVLVNNKLHGKLFSSLESTNKFSKFLKYHFLFQILI